MYAPPESANELHAPAYTCPIARMFYKRAYIYIYIKMIYTYIQHINTYIYLYICIQIDTYIHTYRQTDR